jgi:hypothetical protein
MYTPPNPVAAAQTVIRETVARFTDDPRPVQGTHTAQNAHDEQVEAITEAQETPRPKRVPRHQFTPMSVATQNYCGTNIDGRACCRPITHNSHRPEDVDGECGICGAENGSWMFCICDYKCESRLCRWSNQDIFRWEDVPVPNFRRPDGTLNVKEN